VAMPPNSPRPRSEHEFRLGAGRWSRPIPGSGFQTCGGPTPARISAKTNLRRIGSELEGTIRHCCRPASGSVTTRHARSLNYPMGLPAAREA